MQPRQFNMLALSAVISLIAAGVVHSFYNDWNDEKVTGQKLFPSLATGADRTGEIAIQKGEAKITLKKSADGKVWGLAERGGYPVDPMKVRKLVVSLGDAEMIERKTSNDKLYGQLDLGDPKAKDAASKLIRLNDKSGSKIAEVVIGKERRGAFGAGKAGTYVRKPGDAQTWLAKMELDASTDVVDWVKPAFFVIDDKKIASMVVKDGDKVVYSIGREAAPPPAKADDKKDAKADPKKTDAKKPNTAPQPFKFVDVPAGKKVKASIKINDLVTGVRTLEMLDVRKAQDGDAKPDMTAEITMNDGTKYLVGMKREDKKRWITVSVPAVGKDDAAAKKLAAATKGWAFEIADWRGDQTFKKADDVFEVVKAEAPKMSMPPGANKAGTAAAIAPAANPAPASAGGKAPEPADADVGKK